MSEVRNLALQKVRETCEFLEREIEYEVVSTRKLVTIDPASGLYFMQEVLKKD